MRHTIGLLAAACLLAHAAVAATFVVRPDGTGDYPTIQAAIDAAVDGDEVVLTDGLFAGDGNRDLDFLGKAIAVRSGSGDPEACAINCGGSPDESHVGVYFRTGEGPGSVLEGVTILNGRATHPPVVQAAAIHCENASPTIHNCALVGGRAEMSGGIYLSGSMASISDCLVSASWSATGSAILVLSGSSVSFERCVISGNATDGYGGGVGVQASQAIFIDCAITGNHAAAGGGSCDPGGGAIHAETAAVITNGCTISGNRTAAGCGGGVVASGPGCVVVLQRTVLRHNCVNDGAPGPFPDAVVGSGCTLTISCSAIDPDAIGGDGTVTLVEPNVLDEPLWCDAWSCDSAPTSGGDYHVRDDSPCLPANNACGARIGALGEGCQLIGVGGAGARPVVVGLRVEPNPIRDGAVRVSFEALAPAVCRLDAFDVAGRRVGSIFEGRVSAGRHVISWAAPAPPGVYLLRLDAGAGRTTTRVVRIE